MRSTPIFGSVNVSVAANTELKIANYKYALSKLKINRLNIS